MKAPIYSRCETCRKGKAEEVEVNVGDKVSFTTTRKVGKSYCLSSKEGKVEQIFDTYITAVYRKKLFRLDKGEFTLLSGLGSLTVMMSGECDCEN